MFGLPLNRAIELAHDVPGLRVHEQHQRAGLDTKPRIMKKKTKAEKDLLIREAMEKGIPLNQIEAYLDWLELSEQANNASEVQDVVPDDHAPNILPPFPEGS